MSISAPPINSDSWLLADWVEFKALASEFSIFRINELSRFSDENQNAENINIADQDNKNGIFVERIVEEIDFRIESLGDSYPFVFSSQQDAVLLKSTLSVGSLVYLYCLYITHSNRNEILRVTPALTNSDRDIMQICSTLAAAGYVRGNAISFGFPRPDHSNFLDALKRVYELMGEGSVRDELPPASAPSVKDGAIDVISWSDHPDGAGGRHYVLGQVATGENWKEKALSGVVEVFHRIYFENIPPSRPNEAMFIPFCIDLNEGVSLKDMVEHLSHTYGVIFYRYRLPYYAQVGVDLAETSSELTIERLDEIDKITDFVESFRQSFT